MPVWGFYGAVDAHFVLYRRSRPFAFEPGCNTTPLPGISKIVQATVQSFRWQVDFRLQGEDTTIRRRDLETPSSHPLLQSNSCAGVGLSCSSSKFSKCHAAFVWGLYCRLR